MEVDGSGSDVEDIEVSRRSCKRKGKAVEKDPGEPQKNFKISQLLKGKACIAAKGNSPVVPSTPKLKLQDARPQLDMMDTDRISLEEKGTKVRIPDPEFSRGKLKLLNPLKTVKAESDSRVTSSPQYRARKLLPKDEEVYVRLDDTGLYGSWHRAKIHNVKPGLRLVQYHDLDDEVTGKALREWVQFGKQAPRGRLPAGTRLIKDGKPLLRPGGPGNPPNDPCFRPGGGWPRSLWVEVLESNTWWEGVLEEDVTEDMIKDGHAFVDIRYPLLRHIVEEVELRDIRVCKDWNQETGEWTIRGKCED